MIFALATSACSQGEPVDDLAATEAASAIALEQPLPYGVDVSGSNTAITALQQPTTLGDLLTGKRYTVLHTFAAVSRAPEASGSLCQADDCRQVEIYNHTDGATIVATVDLVDQSVLDVHVLPYASPALTGALADTIMAVVGDDERVRGELGGQQFEVVMGPVAVRQDAGPCASNWCVLVDLAPEGTADGQGVPDALVVIVDVDREQVVEVFWRSTLRREPSQ